MDLNDIRAWHTAVLFLVFLGIIWWAYGKNQKKSFDEAANLPFAEEDEAQHQATLNEEKQS